MTVKLIDAPATPPKPHKAGIALLNFSLADNGDDTCTVFGDDKAGNQVDISALATIVVTSDTPTTLTVDPPIGVTFAMHAVGPIGTANVTVVATWNDGSIGPFTFTLPVATQLDAANAVEIVPGVPTAH